MASTARTQAACLRSAVADLGPGLYADRLPPRPQRFSSEHLLWAAFGRETGMWRMTFDAHVRHWQRAVSEETFERFHTDRVFAQAYEDCRKKADETHAEWVASLRWGRADHGQA